MNAPRRRRIRMHPALSALAAVIVLGAIVLGPQHWSSEAGRGAEVARAQPTPTASPEPIGVLAVTVQTGTAEPFELRAVGTLRPRRQVDLAFAVAGVIARLDAVEGASIAGGAPLAQLDPVPFSSAVAQAEAGVRYLERSLERSELLHAQKALTDEELDGQRAELEAARAQLRLARWSLDRSNLRAPFAGQVLARHVELGQVVAAGTPAFAFAELAVLEFDAALPASDLDALDTSGPVQVIVRDLPRSPARGRVDHAPLRSDERSGSVPIRVVVENGDRTLLPGMVVQARFSVRERSAEAEGVVVPLSSLRLDDRGASVWRIDDGQVHRVAVELGRVRGEHVVVTGLRAGDRVVDQAPDRLREGDAVVVVDTAEVQR